MKFLSVIVALLCANFAFADSELTQQEKAFGCVKPKTEQKFDYVECINQKKFAIVGNIVQTPHGDFPYPLGLVDNNGKLILPNEYHAITYPREWGKKHGVIDNTGKIIVPIEYDFIDDTLQSTDPYNFDLSQDYIRASQDDKDYLFDKIGKQVKQK